jgi:uncharacterized membrane protein
MESSVQATPPPRPPSQGSPPGGFFNALMDTRFNTLITPSLVRFVYVIAMILIALGMLALVVVGFAEGAGSGIVLLIIAPLLGLFYLIVTRLWLELVVVLFKIRDAAEEIAGNTRRSAP